MSRYRDWVAWSSVFVVLVLLSCALMPHAHASDECFLCQAQALDVDARSSAERFDTLSWGLPDFGPDAVLERARSNVGARAPPA